MGFSWLLYSTQKNFLCVLMNSQPDFRKKNPLESEKKIGPSFFDYDQRDIKHLDNRK